MSSEEQKQQVRRRRVFYIPGYDPIHPRRYRELYRKEGAAQSEVSGYALDLKPKTTKGPYGWHVLSEQEGARVETDVEVLYWSDIVRDSMSNSIPLTYLRMARTAWIYIGSGVLGRLMRMRKGPVIAALYPVVMMILYLVVAVALGWGAASLVMLADPWLPKLLLQLVGLGVGLLVVAAVLRWFRAQDGRIYTYYLVHNYIYSAQFHGANPPEFETRIDRFVEAIAAAMQEDVDEVLVVGHSSGAHLGVSVLADLVRGGHVPASGPELSFLTLGHVMPMVSFLPKADRLRGDLNYLCTREELTWVDVTAPGDGCAFALCDPVSVSGAAAPGKRWPLVFSAAFSQTLTPKRWAELRWRFFRLHFQYLCAFDAPRDYDYFRITAGPMTLAERYSGRSPSKSRIDKTVSKYTSMAA